MMMTNRRTSLWLASIVTVAIASLAMTMRVGAGARASSPPSLEEALSRALEWSPDVLLAKSEVQRAEAQLKAARLRVSRDVAEMYAERDASVHELDSLRRKLERADVMMKQGLESETARFDLLAQLRAVESRIATIDASIRYLTGGDELAKPERKPSDPKPRPVARPTFTQHHEEILSMKGDLDFQDVELTEIFKYLDALMGDKQTLVVDMDVLEYYGTHELTIRVTNLTFEQVLTILCDSIGDLAFVARDYGFRVTTLGQAKRILAPSIPELPYEPR